MSKHLVIVESAGKIKKIGEYLGPNYIVKASFGHCMDLDPKTLSIDVENNYKPNYIISEGKHKLVKELKDLASHSASVILAADNDREGEAIAWSLANILNLENPPRIIFTEITKKAIQTAIENPKEINIDMVHAQQARRLLDRLVGYKISPILQNNLNDKDAKSAGRVQSVLVKIINDKEEEINNSISSTYLKAVANLDFNKNKMNCISAKKFDTIENAKEFLSLINKNTVFKVIDIQNKTSVKKPSPPFITSSLQQEASTKLKFNVKKTMEVAQKLYEGGHITYMRTDSPNLSQDAINACKKYILDKYGKDYSHPVNYASSGTAQEAHEAIRPTNINQEELADLDKDQIRLYKLIWNRTIASQMAHAKLNIQTITVDNLNDDKSIMHWLATYESIIFDGFLILYDNTEENSEENVSGKVEIKVGDILKYEGIKISEEYNKLPLRFNEANLVKFLEKNNIGRPSTYATIINKIIERNYVEIKDIEGFKKESKIIELDKKYKMKELVKEVVIGKENKKIVPTELGIKITKFLEKNFHDIMQIDFTSEFETYLDKIAEKKAKWYNVLDMFYKKFNPMVEELNKTKLVSSDKSIGFTPEGLELFVGKGKYGPYVKYVENEKFKYTSISEESITLEDAIKAISFPKLLGKINKKHVELAKGQYGLYLKYDKKNYSIGSEDENITLEKAREIIEGKNNVFIVKDKTVYVKKGQFGPYLQITGGSKTQNIPIPKDIDIDKINLKNILEIIALKNGTKKTY
jgi:DNA topoisomerase I